MSALRDGLLVGRDDETKLLRGAVAQARAGQGRTVLVEGEPGIGKTALVNAASTRASAAGLYTVWVSGAKDCEHDEKLLDRAERAASLGPVAVIFEDLHAADEAALALWRQLALTTAHAPTLLIGTRRPVPQRPSVDRLRREATEGGGLVITLAVLAPQHVADLASGMTRATAGPGLLDHLEAAGGNPRYVRELIHAAWESEALRVTEGVAEFGTSDTQPVLAGPIGSRLDFLRPRTVEVLHGAALLGDPFSVADLSLITGYTPVELVPVIDEALAAGLVEPTGRQLRFRHPALRQALYEATPAERRSALHRQTAWVLTATGAQPERVALHLLDGGDAPPEPWEADWLAEHAEALNRREPATAAELFERAIPGLAAEDPRRAEFEDLLAEANFRLFRFERAVRIAHENAARSTDPERIGRNTWLAGYSLLRARRLDDLLRTLDEAAARTGVTPRWLARYAALRAVAFSSFDRLDEAREAARIALEAGEQIGDAMAIGYALHSQSVIAVAADQDCAVAVELIDRASEVARNEPELTDLRVMLWMNRFTIGFEIGEPAEALMDWARQMLVTAEASGLVRLSRLRLHVAEVAFELGLWDEAAAGLERIADRALAGPAKRHAILGQITARRDEGDHASRTFAAMRRVLAGRADQSAGEPDNSRLFVMAAQALEHERDGEPRAAVDVLAACLNLGRPNHPVRYRLLPTLTRLALAVDDRALAQEAAHAAEKDAQQEPIDRRRLTDLWCRGLVDGDPSAVSAAADLLRETGLRAALGNALEDAAELYARAGDLQRARGTLVEALEVYDGLGAAWDARRAASRLRAHGVRVRATSGGRRAASGPEALTPTERKVAEMVVEGCSNPDVAERLNLSRRTVESHVSRILTKLGVSARGEVRALLPPVDP